MSYLKAADTICGQEAVGTMTVYDSSGGSTVENMFWGKNLEAKVDINKVDVFTLGKRGAQHKPNGWSGSGSMTIYYVTSVFRKMILDYINTGVPKYFDIQVTNNDPASTIGAQTVLLKNCCLGSVPVAKFDTEAELLDETVDFTFDGYDVLAEFVEPTLGS